MTGSRRPVLMLTTALPGQVRSGGEVVSQAIIDALRAGGTQPRVVGYRRSGDDRPPEPWEQIAGTRPIESDAAGLRAVGWMARAIVSRTAYSVAKYRSRAYRRAVAEALVAGVEAVIADHAQVSFACARVENAPLIYVAHNVERGLYAELAESAQNPLAGWAYRREARLLDAIERDLVQRADQVWALTAEDRDVLRNVAAGPDIRLLEVPSALDQTAAARAPVPNRDVVLLGNWTWRPNARGLRWFVDDVVPRLRGACAIAVAGSGADWLRGRHGEDVEVVGPVADALSFLAGARAIAVPALGGGGVQVKTLDAIATGLPVIASTAAVRGLADLPATVTVAEDADAFAAALRAATGSAGDPAAREEALRWSRERRARFAASVNAGIRDVIDSRRIEPTNSKEAATAR
ncbi:MAG: glycosyltransferase [Actinobacteria bacterium]|nr:glycosyltransferase [Actinomycetota bacterium]